MRNATALIDFQRKPPPNEREQDKAINDALIRKGIEITRLRKSLIEALIKEVEKEFTRPSNQEFIREKDAGEFDLRSKSSDGTLVRLLKIDNKAGKTIRVSVERLSPDGSYCTMSYFSKNDMFLFNQQLSDPKKNSDTTFRAAKTLLPSIILDFQTGTKQRLP